MLAVHTGLRQGELLGLQWEDADLDGTVVLRTLTGMDDGRPVLTASKTAKSRRRVKLTAAAVDSLKRHRKRQLKERMARSGLWRNLGLVFTTEGGTPLNRHNLSRRSSSARSCQRSAFTTCGTRAPRCCSRRACTPSFFRSCWGTLP